MSPPNTERMAAIANAESAVHKANRKLQAATQAMRLHLDTFETLVGDDPLALKAADVLAWAGERRTTAPAELVSLLPLVEAIYTARDAMYAIHRAEGKTHAWSRAEWALEKCNEALVAEACTLNVRVRYALTG